MPEVKYDDVICMEQCNQMYTIIKTPIPLKCQYDRSNLGGFHSSIAA